MNKGLEDLVDLMFDTDMEEVMKEKSTLEYIHKLQQENKQLKEEKDSLYNALITTRTKYNNDKARYRRKAKRYKSILTELEETIKHKIKGFKENKDYFIDEKDMYDLDNLIKELREKYK